MNNRLRVAFLLTIILGAIWASAGLFDSLTQFGIGVCVASLGVIGYGAVDYVDYHRSERLRQYRAEVWHRRDLEAIRDAQIHNRYEHRRDGL